MSGEDPQEKPPKRPPFVETLRPGMEGRVEHVVEERHLADSLGNRGAKVLATPIIIGWLEDISSTIVRPHLPERVLSVGTLVNVRHLSAALAGFTVVFRSRLREVDGRRLVFDVEAHDGVEKVAEGVHERFIVDEEKFLAKAAKKRPESRE